MAESKVRPQGQLARRRTRWRVFFSKGVIAIVVFGAAMVALAAWSHFSTITPLIRGERVSCGSLADPVDYDIVSARQCSGLILVRHVIRAGALMALVVFVMLPLMVIWARRWTAQRSFRMSDGPTAIRWAAKRDRNTLRASIDDDVLTALRWSPDDRDAFLDSLVSGWGSGVLIVTETGIDRAIGAILVSPASVKPLVTRLYFWVAPSRRAQGHGRRAVRLAAQLLVDRHSVLIADATADNPAAHAVLEAAGFGQTSLDDDRARFTRQIEQPIEQSESVESGEPSESGEASEPDDQSEPGEPSESVQPDEQSDPGAPGEPGEPDSPAASPPLAKKAPAVLFAVVGWTAMLMMVVLLAWSVTEAVTEHTETVFVAAPAGEIECGSLSSRVDHDIDSYNRSCDAALFDNEADRFRGIATGALSLLGVLVAVGLILAARSASPAAVAARARPLTPAQVRAVVLDVEPLTDGETRVRTVRVADASAVAESIDDVVMSAMGWPEGAPAGVEASVAHQLVPGMLVVTVGETDRVIGVVSLEPIQPGRREPKTRRLRVGTWIGPDDRGQGHMSRALGLVSAVLIENGIDLMGESGVDNIAAQRAFERAGFIETGRRTVELPNGAKLPGIVYEYPSVVSG